MPDQNIPVVHVVRPGAGADFEHQIALCGAPLTANYLRKLLDSNVGLPLCQDCRAIAKAQWLDDSSNK